VPGAGIVRVGRDCLFNWELMFVGVHVTPGVVRFDESMILNAIMMEGIIFE
jgi:hypothetical protein